LEYDLSVSQSVLGALLIALLLAGLHLSAPAIRRLPLVPEAATGSFAGGLAVSYVFLHVLPELAEGKRAHHLHHGAPAADRHRVRPAVHGCDGPALRADRPRTRGALSTALRAARSPGAGRSAHPGLGPGHGVRALSPVLVAVLTALLGGSVLLNVFKEEGRVGSPGCAVLLWLMCP
jgi:hypothetical protein